METKNAECNKKSANSSYPTYEEWKHGSVWKLIDEPAFVLILPMRNGNFPHDKQIQVTLLRSYPTYEEWKHCKRFLILSLLSIVLILPMRNGN